MGPGVGVAMSEKIDHQGSLVYLGNEILICPGFEPREAARHGFIFDQVYFLEVKFVRDKIPNKIFGVVEVKCLTGAGGNFIVGDSGDAPGTLP